jgi:hypothetical protein
MQGSSKRAAFERDDGSGQVVTAAAAEDVQG